ncbi:MAG: transketolase [Candidatus Yonathbacteria bacterium CG_4_10_14_3_um_filter_47_65]|uniref:Transketolase n=1 Tax=Candidatus Yonathbacteria bacterium CG_4_9_14_0_8_um_filter_46_47 TaxID=1975106 RepID=A0A2M8D942_9BACT|nr:MAG: transketolase [Candidatus Yonathbacteria bacterium CG23_combo_of_CG06-09_8_20_14_all_46_18]PIQ31185.1 MAG: transketolase [Candidatus Yonathbacteria bacterium CG17_big_fil_post_rev_8_21_14_2_50_46_19]PIX56401.1 MAG: transketolase [Candidatus Yonathbacteria bacterium CG_4_10_14_3_um_filter_47_65]PIY58022.1 MAG: transketolase [Candidatus Yonathbacteria bacterium CG_4_10_14_0_8_um_filter_47_645]PJB83672.1 MAG: transketolase [Candidatus Yonathbacteria bacterium CG_4_9_14_0_8_um_filter_46_47]
MDMKLNPKLFDEDIEQMPIRHGYGEGILIAGKRDKRVVALCADLTDSTKTNVFANVYPDRFIEMGIGEQSMASVASGLAAMGKIPFLASYAMFSPGRNWEQIRTTICYNNANVKIGGAHAGISVGPDGGTHQAIEDIALMRIIPRMNVIVPCDAIEARKATIAAAEIIGPVYIRLAREATPVITTEETPFAIGEARVVFRPDGDADIGIIAIGSLVYDAIMAAKRVEADGIKARVLNLSTIKPIDTDAIIELARDTKRIITVEEHQIKGGMGSAVAEVLSEYCPVKIKYIGIRDAFGQSGTPEELLSHYGLDRESIVEAVRSLIAT